mmetsp:Transcript_91202/g.195612  ORF Transcript_91202/g.195612 Transcript_91202/m.195612 type:complete len:211 (-) Transcript_91202:220-852(-)
MDDHLACDRPLSIRVLNAESIGLVGAHLTVLDARAFDLEAIHGVDRIVRLEHDHLVEHPPSRGELFQELLTIISAGAHPEVRGHDVVRRHIPSELDNHLTALRGAQELRAVFLGDEDRGDVDVGGKTVLLDNDVLHILPLQRGLILVVDDDGMRTFLISYCHLGGEGALATLDKDDIDEAHLFVLTALALACQRWWHLIVLRRAIRLVCR